MIVMELIYFAMAFSLASQQESFEQQDERERQYEYESRYYSKPEDTRSAIGKFMFVKVKGEIQADDPTPGPSAFPDPLPMPFPLPFPSSMESNRPISSILQALLTRPTSAAASSNIDRSMNRGGEGNDRLMTISKILAALPFKKPEAQEEETPWGGKDRGQEPWGRKPMGFESWGRRPEAMEGFRGNQWNQWDRMRVQNDHWGHESDQNGQWDHQWGQKEPWKHPDGQWGHQEGQKGSWGHPDEQNGPWNHPDGPSWGHQEEPWHRPQFGMHEEEPWSRFHHQPGMPWGRFGDRPWPRIHDEPHPHHDGPWHWDNTQEEPWRSPAQAQHHESWNPESPMNHESGSFGSPIDHPTIPEQPFQHREPWAFGPPPMHKPWIPGSPFHHQPWASEPSPFQEHEPWTSEPSEHPGLSASRFPPWFPRGSLIAPFLPVFPPIPSPSAQFTRFFFHIPPDHHFDEPSPPASSHQPSLPIPPHPFPIDFPPISLDAAQSPLAPFVNTFDRFPLEHEFTHEPSAIESLDQLSSSSLPNFPPTFTLDREEPIEPSRTLINFECHCRPFIRDWSRFRRCVQACPIRKDRKK